MGFFDYFYIAGFVFLLVVHDLILAVINSQRLKKISRKTAIQKSIKYDILWIVLSAVNLFLQFEQYRMALGKNDDTGARLHFLAFISWTICGIAHISTVFFNKYIYITPDGLFYKTMIKIQPKDKYRYRIDGDTLELYYKQSDTPAKYRIIKEKDELIKILDENYARYTGD